MNYSGQCSGIADGNNFSMKYFTPMRKEYKTTEFSAHISRSRVRRYLHQQLSQQEMQEVEVHLKNCAHCSTLAAIYVENEEPEHQKTHMKKLKGVLVESVKPRVARFSRAQLKVFRAAAAVVLLFTFSFFALENFVDKDFNLIKKAEKEGNELPDLKVSQKNKPQQAEKANTSLQTETKISEDLPKQDKFEEEEDVPMLAENQPKPVAKVTKPAEKKTTPTRPEPLVETNQKENITTTEAAKPANTAEKPGPHDEVAQKEDQQEKVQQPEEETSEEQAAPKVAPLQRIQKAGTADQEMTVPQQKEIQTIPSTTVGQFRQQ